MKPLIGIGSDVMVREGERDQAYAFLTYVEPLRALGAIALLIPPQPEQLDDLVERLDGILLAGGDDCDPALYGEVPHQELRLMDRRRQENDLELARLARERAVPMLGICLGLQVMNVAAGGTLIQDIGSEIPAALPHASEPPNRRRHQVAIFEETQLGGLIGAGVKEVNSSHHQAIRNVGTGLAVTAEAPDGIIEAIEDRQHPFYLGVQWHPEDMNGDPTATALLAAFVAAARDHRQRRG
jgi:putative glutamine amidotransferase